MNQEGKKKLEALELSEFRLFREGGEYLRMERNGQIEHIPPGAYDVLLVLFSEVMALGADLDETRRALDHETARASSAIDNWQAASSQAQLAKAEQERDRLLAAELGRELARARDAAAVRDKMRARAPVVDNENGPECFVPLDPDAPPIRISPSTQRALGMVVPIDEVIDVAITPQRSQAEAARVVADAHLPGGVPIVPPKEIRPQPQIDQ